MPPRQRRRLRGTGSIERLPSGRYRARLNGQKPEIFDSELDADLWLATQRRRRQDEKINPPPPKPAEPVLFGRMIDEWWETVEHSVKPRTVERYEDHLRPIRQHLGALTLDEIDGKQLQRFVSTIHQDYAPKTVRACNGVVMLVLGHAHRMGDLPRMPPKPVLPRVEKPDLTIPTRRQVEDLALASNAQLWAPVLLAGYCGLREGELLALLRSDVHLDEPVPWLLVRHARNKTSGKTESTKTGRIRRVYLPSPVVDALRVHFEEHPGELLVPVSASVLQKSWERARKACGLERVRFHDLRHAAASMMIAAGLNVLQVSKQLGHANPTQTLNTYGHLWPDSFDQAMAQMNAYLAGG